MTEDKDQDLAGQSEDTQAAESQADKPGRFEQAKAFWRALNAGAEVQPQDFGIEGAEKGQPASAEVQKCTSCEYMADQLREAERKTSEAESLYKRMAADFDNYRRRVDREREEYQGLGIQRVIEALLPALDDLDRAKSSLSKEMPSEKLLENIHMVFARIARCLEQVGVKALDVMGQHFDPRFHEPVQQIETTEHPDGSVVQELRRGYSLNDRVIRPALVNVASNPGVQPEAPTPDEEEQEAEHQQQVYDLSDLEGSEDAEIEGLEKYAESSAGGTQVVDE